MPLEPELEKAIQMVVAEKGQSKSVAKRLIACLEEMSKTDISKEDQNIFFDQVTDSLILKEPTEDAN